MPEAMMRIDISEEKIKALVSESILAQLTPERREEILRQAIQHLVTPSRDSYDKGKSPLEQAFRNAIDWQCQELAREMLKEDALKNKIRDLIAKAAEKALSDESKIIEKVADAITNGLCGSRY